MKGKYDSYKDSGVEWIGEIPSHWENRKGSTIGNYSKGKGIKKDEVKESGYPCVRYGEIYTKYEHIVEGVDSFIDYETTNTSISISENSLLLTGSGETFKDIGKCVVYLGSELIWIGGDIIILKPKKDIDPIFLTYLINSECIRIQREISGRGEIIVHIYSKNFRDMRFPIPPLNEQQQIVQYLDTKTSLIDSLLKKTKKKIKLLKEQRTSLINEVVTKGLNPDVELIDSGVEWIGEIPKHWSFISFNVICNLQQGLQIPFEKRFFEKKEDCYEYITTQSIHKPNQPRQYIQSPKETVLCTEEDIIYGRTGNTGEVVTGVNGVFHNNFFRIDFNRKLIMKEFMVWFLSNERFREHILLLSGVTTIPDLNHSSFFSNKMLIPSLNEQQQIVEFLDKKTTLIDSTISIEEKRIEHLKEYRQSLISEVVIGKIKVTN